MLRSADYELREIGFTLRKTIPKIFDCFRHFADLLRLAASLTWIYWPRYDGLGYSIAGTTLCFERPDAQARSTPCQIIKRDFGVFTTSCCLPD